MKYMGGWGPDDYDACSLSLREEILAIMQDEHDDAERRRNQ